MARAIAVPAAEKAPATAAAGTTWFRRRLRSEVVPRIVLVLMCLVFVLPFYWMMATALKTSDELTAYPPTLFPRSLQWSNFAAAVEVFPF